MRDVKALAKTENRDTRMGVAMFTLLLLVVVLITSITGAGAPV